MRYIANQLVDGHSKIVRFESHVDETATSPSGALTVNILRIFREGLTNAVKCSSQDAIDVAMTTDTVRGEIRLVITNDYADGSRRGGAGVDLGRGTTYMRQRAEELGGTLSLTFRERCRLTLCVPLDQPPQAASYDPLPG